jgi:phenylalanyl-tRNA synthetase beta chain
MKLSLNWLRRYVDHGLSAEDLSFRLTMAGLEVEGVEAVGRDTVFEIEVTPNRPDCLSVLGLAREVSAIVDKDLNGPVTAECDDIGEVDVTIEDPAACARYIATRIDGVSVKPLADEQAQLLQSMGNKPLGNIVDITNFVLFEYGQPLHAFDYDKLDGGKIIVRRARKGEKIVTLDNVERTLDESILVIADAHKPVAIAGIMGGAASGVTSATKRVLLESAVFDMGLIRRASRKLGLTSDSCYRFERGIAWATVEAASNRAAGLILEQAGGAVAARRDCVMQAPGSKRREVTVSAGDIQKLLGAPLDLARAERILKRLGFIVAAGDKALTVVSPHFRNDVSIKEDVIEEVARIVGYDSLPMTLPQVPAVNIVVDQEKVSFNRRLTDAFVGLGYNQVVTYSLVGGKALADTNYRGDVVRLQNAMSAEQEMMRPSALANMLIVAAANINRGQKDLRLFDVGKKYLPGGERWTLSVLVSGRAPADWRLGRRGLLDLYDIKGAIDAAFAALRVKACAYAPAENASFEAGQCAAVSIDGNSVGSAGRVADEVLARFDIKKTPVYFAEIDIECAAGQVVPRAKFMPIDGFPAMTRDISLAVKDVSFDAIRKVCLDNSKGLLKRIDFVECYSGDKIEKGYKGYVLSLGYQSAERTLTDDEVNALHQGITVRLVEGLGVIQR